MKKKHQVDRSIGQSQYQDSLSLSLFLLLSSVDLSHSRSRFRVLRDTRVQSAAGDDRGH